MFYLFFFSFYLSFFFICVFIQNGCWDPRKISPNETKAFRARKVKGKKKTKSQNLIYFIRCAFPFPWLPGNSMTQINHFATIWVPQFTEAPKIFVNYFLWISTMLCLGCYCCCCCSWVFFCRLPSFALIIIIIIVNTIQALIFA